MLTLFTPAYNRAKTLPRLYESLLRQTCFDFEWLIIDDGSNDDTAELVRSFTGEGKFPVRYICKENGGKHTAHNLALEEARGEWFLCVDSDDTLTSTAVEDILNAAKGLPGNAGIASYKTDMGGTMLGKPFPGGLRYAKMHELNGEFAYAFPTAFARRFPFPVFSGERFMSESVVYDRMDREGRMYLLDKVTMPCEYQPEGYSRSINALMKRNPRGFCLYFMQRVDLTKGTGRLVTAGKYWCFRLMGWGGTPAYSGRHKLTVILSWPLGLCFRVYYKLLRGF